jgi:hypothetical protein
MIIVTAKLAPLLRDLKKIPGQFQRVAKELVDSEARGFVRDAVLATPPFHAKSAPAPDNPGKFATVTGTEAKKAAEAKIDSEASAIFAGVILKGKRTITQAFGHPLKNPVVVATKELHPNVESLWAERAARRFAGKRKTISRGQKAAFYVSSPKLIKAIAARKKNIGKLASGWAAAAEKLNVKLPAWIKRHGTARGGVQIQLGSLSYSIRIQNDVAYGDALQLQSIADRTARARERKLAARLPFVIRGAIKRANREALRAA